MMKKIYIILLIIFVGLVPDVELRAEVVMSDVPDHTLYDFTMVARPAIYHENRLYQNGARFSFYTPKLFTEYLGRITFRNSMAGREYVEFIINVTAANNFFWRNGGTWMPPTDVYSLDPPVRLNQTIRWGLITDVVPGAFLAVGPDADSLQELYPIKSSGILNVYLDLEATYGADQPEDGYGRVWVDDKILYEGPLPTTSTDDRAGPTVVFRIVDYSIRYVNPIVTENIDLDVTVGDTVDWGYGIAASWGESSWIIIRGDENGLVEDTTIVDGTNAVLSLSGTTFDYIGVQTHTYMIRDSHSLETTGNYAYDTSFAETSRKITVRTVDSPAIQMNYSIGAVDANHDSIAGLPYSVADVTTASGGEAGWTNQPLDIKVNPNSIQGTFDTLLKIPTLPTVVATNSEAIYTGYYENTPDSGITASGVLAQVEDTSTPEIENDNDLSATVYGTWKIDKTPPVVGATHDGGFSFTDTSTDALSGLSSSKPSLIAIVPNGITPVDSDYDIFDNSPTLAQDNYDVWVWATDKAGNKHIERVFANYRLGGGVTIEKDTNQGATLHTSNCQAPENELATIEAACENFGCTIGAKAGIMERSDLTYELTITNTDQTEDGSGTFVDYLPVGTSVTGTITSSGPEPEDDVVITQTVEPSGQIKITGAYTIKSGSTIEIGIPCKVPSYDKTPGAKNIIINQATLDWTLGTGITATNGTSESNYANHQLEQLPSVETQFKKVGADDLNIGLAGAEFLLYKWTGTDSEYTGGNHNQDIVDKENLIDGKWQRVKKDGEDALALTDAFISDGSGDVDLGDLPSGIYTLIETKTAATYELPMGQWTITVDAAKGDAGSTGDWKIEFAGKSNSTMPPAVARVGGGGGIAPEYKVLNAKPFSIGLSGLGGTIGITIFGLTVMLLAGSGYIIYAKKQNKKVSNQ